jgi:hypothetical protein
MANPPTPSGSFIPKRNTGKVSQPRSGKRIYIFSYIAYTFFFATLTAVAGVFLFNQQAVNALSKNISAVNEVEQSLNRDQLDSVKELDERLQLASEILSRHTAPSLLFDALESTVVSDIHLTTFEYTLDADALAILSIGGFANTFDAVMFQRDIMQSNSVLSKAVLTNVGYGSTVLQKITGPNRSGTASDEIFGDATITFAFTEVPVSQGLKYVPRRNVTSVTNVVIPVSDIQVNPDEVQNLADDNQSQ